KWREKLLRSAVDVDYPALQWEAHRVSERLHTGKLLRITGANGTDVRVKLRHRAPVVDDGVVDRGDVSEGRNLTTIPPGRVVVATDESSAEGVLVANRPSYLRGGKVQDGQWEIRGGHLINAWYTEGQSTFDAAYRSAPKGKDIVGLISVGLNPKLEGGVPEVEDQEAGAVTIAVGGNRQFGGKNPCPFLSWVVLGEATVTIDDKPLLDRGKPL
ncbi:MAG: aminopeptidase, partial [Thermoplasmata archaeon]|nr:aminopeptidase [Thermoplasmata archaeon]